MALITWHDTQLNTDFKILPTSVDVNLSLHLGFQNLTVRYASAVSNMLALETNQNLRVKTDQTVCRFTNFVTQLSCRLRCTLIFSPL